MPRIQTFAYTGVYNIVGQIVFFALLFLVGQSLYLPDSHIFQYIILLLLVSVPSSIWTLFFYLQDREEPEPTSYLFLAFLAGMAGAALVALPLEYLIFSIREWMYFSSGFLFIASFCLIGGTFSFIIHVIIRYGFYMSAEFDEPVDGMVYGAFAGSGFAFVSSLTYLAANTDFTLFAAGYTATNNILMYASTGALAGYLYGADKFSPKAKSRTYTSAAFLLGTLLIGTFDFLQNLIFIEGFNNSFFVSFVLTLSLAVIILSAAWLLMTKVATVDESPQQSVVPSFYMLPVLLFGIMLVLTGVSRNEALKGARYVNEEQGIAFNYSYLLSAVPSSGFVSPFNAAATENTNILLGRIVWKSSFYDEGLIEVEVRVYEEAKDISEFSVYQFIGYEEYSSVITDRALVGGHESLRLIYSKIKPQSNIDEEFPSVTQHYTDLINASDKIWILTVTGTPTNFNRAKEMYETVINTIEFKE